MATEIFVCLDLGNDTLKISYAYRTPGGERYGKLMPDDLVNHVAIPAVAYYDEDRGVWEYAEELENMFGKPFHTVVKIKSVLTMFVKPEESEGAQENFEYYRSGELFPKFCFPERNSNEQLFETLVEKKRVFTARGTTPQKMCEGYFAHVRRIVENEIHSISFNEGVYFDPLRSIAIVHPPKQGKRYTEELSRLVKSAFGVAPKVVLTSTQALGLLAFHKGFFSGSERALIFDMGDETVSVSKTWLNDNESVKAGILVDSRKAHSEPVEVGGSDIDEEIARYLEGRIYARETIGYPSDGEEGHIYESGLCANQYLMMKDIKKSKTAMPLANTGMFKEGVPITIHREVLVQRLISEQEFFDCAGIGSSFGAAKAVMDYIYGELRLAVNRDVTKILLAGGMIETHGLLEYIKRELSEKYPHIKVYKFEENKNDGERRHIQFYEASAYASSLGGAIVAMTGYSVDNVLSYSYGTWSYNRGVKGSKKHLKLFAERGSLLKEKENRFSTVSNVIIHRNPQSFIPGEEFYSTIINTKEIEAKRYGDKLTYADDFLVIGEEGDAERLAAEEVIDLKIVGGGKGTEVGFYYRGDKVALSTRTGEVYVNYEEGFVVDRDGRAVPFFSNLRAKNNDTVVAKNLRTGSVYSISTKDIEFRLQMADLTVTTQT